MKAVAINAANAETINSVISLAEGRSTKRTMSNATLERLIKQLEQHPAIALLPKKSRAGITAWLQQSHKLPSSYKYAVEATAAKVQWKAGKGWHLVEVQRTRNIQSAQDRIDVSLPAAAAVEAWWRLAETFRTV